jgi:chromosome segregation ATPase
MGQVSLLIPEFEREIRKVPIWLRLLLFLLGAGAGFTCHLMFFANQDVQYWKNKAEQMDAGLQRERQSNGRLIEGRDSLNRKVQSLENTEHQVETLQAARTQLETENAGLKQQVSSLNTTLTGIRNSMEGLRKETDAQKAKAKLNTQAIPSEIR